MNKRFTNEFKEMAVNLSYNSDKPISLLSKELGISESVIYLWRNKMNPDKKETKKPEPDELKELKKKLAKLEVENEILKKALAICNRM